MEQEKKTKYYGFVVKFIGEKKVCMGTMLERKYKEEFFNDAVKDGILEEIEKNNDGKRQFRFTEYAKKVLE